MLKVSRRVFQKHTDHATDNSVMNVWARLHADAVVTVVRFLIEAATSTQASA